MQTFLFGGTLPLQIDDQGEGRPYVLLHGGAGGASMAGLAEALASDARSVLVTLPGFDGQPRPGWLNTVGDLALMTLALLDALGLDDAVLVGNSAGGWIAAEVACRRPARLGGLVLIDAVGLDPTDTAGGVANPIASGPGGAARLAFHDPGRFGASIATPDLPSNQQALMVYAGEPYMHDPALRERLASVAVPTLVVWGESDGIVAPAYGRQFADLIPGARFDLVAEAGHFPQVEQVGCVVHALRSLD